MTDLDSFLDRFSTFGEKPSTETYLPLFHPDATLFDAGMERPITVPEIPAHIEGILGLVPDFRMTPERWREHGGTVFVEARNRATLAGHEARWRSVYCVDLRGDRVIRGRRYYDRRLLYARLGPGVPSLPDYTPVAGGEPEVADPFDGPEAIIHACADAWHQGDPASLQRLFREDGTMSAPDLPRPIARGELGHYYAALWQLLQGVRMELLSWAGDDELAFAEWCVRGESGGQPIEVKVVDRFDLAGGLILATRGYFDTLDLLAQLSAKAE